MTPRRLFGALALCLLANPAQAAEAAGPRAALEFFIGLWTVKGSEATYRESCEWLSPESFVICTAKDTDPAGPSQSISIFGYDDEDRAYTYAGYGSGGSSRALRGWLRDGVWVFTGQRDRGTESVRWQVTIAPVPTGFLFVQQTSSNGGPWVKTVDAEYRRIRK